MCSSAPQSGRGQWGGGAQRKVHANVAPTLQRPTLVIEESAPTDPEAQLCFQGSGQSDSKLVKVS